MTSFSWFISGRDTLKPRMESTSVAEFHGIWRESFQSRGRKVIHCVDNSCSQTGAAPVI